MDRVLIVEDDTDINNFINDYFIIKGYSTVQSFSGTEGLLRLNTDKEICCIILDLMLPGISGEEIIKNVRDVSDVPIIAVSAKSGDDTKIEVLKLGGGRFFVKTVQFRRTAVKS